MSDSEKRDEEKFTQLEIGPLRPLTSEQSDRLQSFTNMSGSENKNHRR